MISIHWSRMPDSNSDFETKHCIKWSTNSNTGNLNGQFPVLFFLKINLCFDCSYCFSSNVIPWNQSRRRLITKRPMSKLKYHHVESDQCLNWSKSKATVWVINDVTATSPIKLLNFLGWWCSRLEWLCANSLTKRPVVDNSFNISGSLGYVYTGLVCSTINALVWSLPVLVNFSGRCDNFLLIWPPFFLWFLWFTSNQNYFSQTTTYVPNSL